MRTEFVEDFKRLGAEGHSYVAQNESSTEDYLILRDINKIDM